MYQKLLPTHTSWQDYPDYQGVRNWVSGLTARWRGEEVNIISPLHLEFDYHGRLRVDYQILHRGLIQVVQDVELSDWRLPPPKQLSGKDLFHLHGDWEAHLHRSGRGWEVDYRWEGLEACN